MSLDANFKRFFPAVVCGLLAFAAYFQASGIGEMVASSVGQAPAAEAPVLATPTFSEDRRSGEPILARNPFDSVTGPLDGSDMALPEAPRLHQSDVSGDPSLDDPTCDFGRVVLIADSDDAEWSFAAIDLGGSSKLRRVGDDVQGHTLEAMAWDRVWLKSSTARCQMKMGDKSNAAPAPKPAPRAGTADPRRHIRSGPGSDKLPDELASKIQKVSDTEFNVERAVVDAILEQQAELMRRTRVRPIKNGDKTTGIGVSRIGAGSLLDTLGLKNGDEIRTINGFELTDPQKALEAYGRLRTADHLTVQVVRGGAPTSIEFNIK